MSQEDRVLLKLQGRVCSMPFCKFRVSLAFLGFQLESPALSSSSCAVLSLNLHTIFLQGHQAYGIEDIPYSNVVSAYLVISVMALFPNKVTKVLGIKAITYPFGGYSLTSNSCKIGIYSLLSLEHGFRKRILYQIV